MKKEELYTPPFTVSAEAINLVAEISAQVERFAIRVELAENASGILAFLRRFRMPMSGWMPQAFHL